MPISDAMPNPTSEPAMGPGGSPIDEGQQPSGGQPSGEPPEQEKRLYEMMVANAREFVFDDENAERLTATMQRADPVKVIAQTATDIMEAITSSAAQSMGEPSPEVTLAAATSVINDLMELGVEAGAISFEEGTTKEDFQKKVMTQFMDLVMGDEVQPAGAPPVSGAPGAPAPPQERTPIAGAIGQAMGGPGG